MQRTSMLLDVLGFLIRKEFLALPASADFCSTMRTRLPGGADFD